MCSDMSASSESETRTWMSENDLESVSQAPFLQALHHREPYIHQNISCTIHRWLIRNCKFEICNLKVHAFLKIYYHILYNNASAVLLQLQYYDLNPRYPCSTFVIFPVAAANLIEYMYIGDSVGSFFKVHGWLVNWLDCNCYSLIPNFPESQHNNIIVSLKHGKKYLKLHCFHDIIYLWYISYKSCFYLCSAVQSDPFILFLVLNIAKPLLISACFLLQNTFNSLLVLFDFHKWFDLFPREREPYQVMVNRQDIKGKVLCYQSRPHAGSDSTSEGCHCTAASDSAWLTRSGARRGENDYYYYYFGIFFILFDMFLDTFCIFARVFPSIFCCYSWPVL